MASTALATPSAGPAPGLAIFTDDAREDWRECPIDPAWILAGAPRARIVPLATGRDEAAATALWECSRGRFRWHFGWDETVHVLAGRVDVEMPDGTSRRLTPGSVAFFPAGSTAVWTVIEPVRKLAVLHRSLPRPLAATLRGVDRLRAAAARMRRAPRRLAERLGASAAPAALGWRPLAAALAAVGALSVFALDLV